MNVANQMIEGTEMEKEDCEAIFMKAHKDGNQVSKPGACQPLCQCAWVKRVFHRWE